jgi:hypothetical protein
MKCLKEMSAFQAQIGVLETEASEPVNELMKKDSLLRDVLTGE